MADWIRDAVRRAASSGHGYGNLEAPDDRELRLYVERFTGTSGAPYVAAVVADRGELEDEYVHLIEAFAAAAVVALLLLDRKSTRLNSSHGYISYAVFCLKKKNQPYF